MVDIKAMAAATAPREFELSYTTTIEDVYEKLNTHASAFKMPFKIKGGIPGKRISFEKEPNLDVTVWSLLRMATKLKSWQISRRTQQQSMVCELTKTA